MKKTKENNGDVENGLSVGGGEDVVLGARRPTVPAK
jgi:hypothetical protein